MVQLRISSKFRQLHCFTRLAHIFPSSGLFFPETLVRDVCANCLGLHMRNSTFCIYCQPGCLSPKLPAFSFSLINAPLMTTVCFSVILQVPIQSEKSQEHRHSQVSCTNLEITLFLEAWLIHCLTFTRLWWHWHLFCAVKVMWCRYINVFNTLKELTWKYMART